MIPVNIKLPDKGELRDGAKLRGYLKIEVFDNAENMNLISWSEGHNIITNEGLDAILDIMLHADTQITTWYCVMSESDTSPAAGMTYAVPSFTETQAYDGATRPVYDEAAAASQSITNEASKASFTMNATKTLYGAGLVGGGGAPATKGDAAGGGTLFNYGAFGASQPVVDDNVVNLTITISAADDGV
jgi:hypothetical protein